MGINYRDTIFKSDIKKNISQLTRQRDRLIDQLNSNKFIWWKALIYLAVGFTIGYILCLSFTENGPGWNPNKNWLYVLIPTTVFVLGYWLYISSRREELKASLSYIESDIEELGGEDPEETDDKNFFTKLVQINFKYLDQYYLQTQEQADKSFKLSSIAAAVGFLLIVAGIILLYIQKGSVDNNLPGILTTSSGLLTEFIAAVFFYLYNQTILKMSEYHQKLVLTQNISLALKITDDMDGASRESAQNILIDRLTSEVNKHLTEIKQAV